MVKLFDATGTELRTFSDVIEFNRTYCEYMNGGYRGRIYADAEAGEYFDDPDNPLPIEAEPVGNPDVDEILNVVSGASEVPTERSVDNGDYS